MKKVFNICLLAALLLPIVSCARLDQGDLQKIVVEARWEGNPSSKTAIQADGTSVWWLPQETINLFYGTQYGGKLTSMNQEPTETAQFSGTLDALPGALPETSVPTTYWAVYPYQDSNTCDGNSVTLTVPAVQEAAEGTFANALFPAVAKSTGTTLLFYNVCGGAQFVVENEGIRSVVFESLGGESLVGKVKVSMNAEGFPQIDELTNGTSLVRVNAPDGGTFEVGKQYYAVFLPQTLSAGLSIVFEREDARATAKLERSIVVHRSLFGVLENLDAGGFFPLEVPLEGVDLGLSVKWSNLNVGAKRPEESGKYFAWGETESKGEYSWSTYIFGTNSSGPFSKYSTRSQGTVDNKTVLDAEDDVAYVKLGGNWRMPTDDEWSELLNNCTWEWTTLNYVKGISVTSKKNGNSIFLPAAGYMYDTFPYRSNVGSSGYYWSSSLNTGLPRYARFLCFNSEMYMRRGDRSNGLSVRPVLAQWIAASYVDLNKTSLRINVADSETLVATVKPENATDKTVTWSSSDEAIATVDANGKVTAVSKGSASIKATANDGSGVYAECDVNVFYRIDKPVAVDLGLSVKWADANLGSEAPEDYGDYFAWGETETKEEYIWGTYKWCVSDYYNLTKYNTSTSWGTVDNIMVLAAEDDVARVRLGGNWRMPTDAEWTELLDNCTWIWTTLNGVKGREVTSKKNGNSIFLPAAGYRYDSGRYVWHLRGSSGLYWSSSLNTEDHQDYAYYLYFNSDGAVGGSHDRCFGQSVRPVTE